MAKAQTTSDQLGLTRGKAILIGVLGIALVGVLYIQYQRFGGGDEETYVEVTTPAARPIPRPQQQSRATSMNTDSVADTEVALLEFDQAKWKAPEVSKVAMYDPFALPAAFPQPPRVHGDASESGEVAGTLDPEEESQRLANALEELRSQLDDLKSRGVHVIIGQRDQYVAMIGERMVRVGDEINGFTVTEIDPEQGVRVERKEPQ